MEYRLADNVELMPVFSAQNIIRQRSSFHYSQMSEKLDTFFKIVEEAGGHPSGPLVYSLNNMPNEELILDIEFFLPLEEDYMDIEGMKFSSYFEIPNLIVTVVKDDFEELTKMAYEQLLWTLEENGRDVNTPFYHVLDLEKRRVTVLLGYAY